MSSQDDFKNNLVFEEDENRINDTELKNDHSEGEDYLSDENKKQNIPTYSVENNQLKIENLNN